MGDPLAKRLGEWLRDETMPAHRHGRRVQPTAPRHNVHLQPDVVRQFGDTWATHFWHTTVWSHLLIEIPTQLFAHYQSECVPLRQKLANEERYWPDSDIATQLRNKLSQKPSILCVLEPGGVSDDACTVARIYRNRSLTRLEVRVDFAIRCDGQLVTHCVNTRTDRPKLPAVLLGPYADRNPLDEAARLVRAAIGLVAEDAPPTTPSGQPRGRGKMPWILDGN